MSSRANISLTDTEKEYILNNYKNGTVKTLSEYLLSQRDSDHYISYKSMALYVRRFIKLNNLRAELGVSRPTKSEIEKAKKLRRVKKLAPNLNVYNDALKDFVSLLEDEKSIPFWDEVLIEYQKT